MDIILASSSPRRAELLRRFGVPYRITLSKVAEGQPHPPWSQWVEEIACRKAHAVAASSGEIIIAADTIVVKDDVVLGKPTDEQEAKNMLTFLSGGVHEVMTGICVIDCLHERVLQDVEITKVYFRPLTAEEIKAYIACNESLDKAGAYGIQGVGSLLVEKIEGCYYNVVGLPLVKTMTMLRKCGVKILGGEK